MDDRIDTVVVATDGSVPARRGAAHGIALAAALDAECHALSVVADAPSTLLRSILGEADLPEEIREAADEAVAGVVDLAADHPDAPDVTTAVRAGRPHDEIEAYAAEVDADAIVLGTQGRSGLDRVLLGSVAENVLRTASVPILVVPPGAEDLEATWPTADHGGVAATATGDGGPGPYDHLLVPTDGSEGADRAADWAVWLAARFEAPLHALFAADASPFPTTARSKQLLEALRSAGNESIEGVRQRGDAAGVEVTGAVGAGAPGPTILEFVGDEDVDLVVMGTHGRSGAERAILGSVTEHVVRHGAVPVFCVPPRAAE